LEYIEEHSSDKMSIDSFSKIITQKWNTDGDIIRNYIFANISISLARSNEMKKDIDKIYMSDKLRYYNAATSSSFINHIIVTQGTIEQEIYARKVLGILIEAETNNIIRSKIIKILRKHYSIIYNAVKKRNKEELKNKYMKMDIITRNVEARFDAAIYLYFATYISSEVVDQGFIISILNDIEYFEFGNLINQNVQDELENYKSEIQEIKALIKREYGKVFNYKEILRHNNEYIRNLGEFLEDMFITNKLDINNIFQDSEFINIDKIILSYVRATKNKNPDVIIYSVISGIVIQLFINEYKNARNLYFESDGEVLNYELNNLKEKLNDIENENNNLKSKIEELNKEKLLYDKKLNYELNNINNINKLKIKAMEDKIKNLEVKLNKEKSLRLDLEYLREYEFNLNNNFDNFDSNKNLEDYITNKKIIIIGGDKEWRRRFRIKYPEIRTLNGFNENFDISILNNSDYIFFYTKYMNHSTFHKAMNFIKFNQCKFGYIGKTNMELVEQEIIEKISRYEDEKYGDRFNNNN
jgi:hypothetical protein